MAEPSLLRNLRQVLSPIIEIIYRYNNKHRIHHYLRNPTCLTRDVYRSFK